MIGTRIVDRADRAATLAVVAAAFGREDEARLVERLWAADAVAFERLATMNDAVVGYCAFSAVAVTPDVDATILGLAPVAVAPAYQKQGVGSALIRQCLAQLEKDATDAVVLLGHPAYYPRFGFRPAAECGLRWDVRDAGPAFQSLEFRPVFDGAPRTTRFHPAFAAF